MRVACFGIACFQEELCISIASFEVLTSSCSLLAFDCHLVGVEPILHLLERPCVLIEDLVVQMIGVVPIFASS